MNSPSKLKDRILLTIQKISTPNLILYALAFNLVLTFIFALFRDELGYIIHANFLPFDSLYEELFMVLLFAPFIETSLYQYVIIDITLFLTQLVFKKELIILAVLISAISFALSHLFDYSYMIHMLLAGLSYSIFYIIVKLRNQNAFMFTVIVHVLCNLLVLGLKQI